jgi:hypothetical protein
MKQVSINNATYTEIHAGQSLARCTPSVTITLADVPTPGSAALTSNSAANVAIYLPVGKATFAKSASTNITLDIIE